MTKPTIHHDDRAEVDDLLSEALNGSRQTDADSIARFMASLESADRAGRHWPDDVRALALWEWTQRRQTSIAKRESVVLIDHGGRRVGKATRVGKRVRSDNGEQGFQQSLIADMSWDELQEWAALIDSQIEGLSANQTMVKRLEQLHAQMPDTVGPREACERIGTTVEEYLTEASA